MTSAATSARNIALDSSNNLDGSFSEVVCTCNIAIITILEINIASLPTEFLVTWVQVVIQIVVAHRE